MKVVIERFPYTGLKPTHKALDATYLYSVLVESPNTPSNTAKVTNNVTLTHYQTWAAVCTYINGLSGAEPT